MFSRWCRSAYSRATKGDAISSRNAYTLVRLLLGFTNLDIAMGSEAPPLVLPPIRTESQRETRNPSRCPKPVQETKKPVERVHETSPGNHKLLKETNKTEVKRLSSLPGLVQFSFRSSNSLLAHIQMSGQNQIHSSA